MNEDLGDSLDSVEALSKKHDDFEKSLAAQEEKIKVRTCCVLSLNSNRFSVFLVSCFFSFSLSVCLSLSLSLSVCLSACVSVSVCLCVSVFLFCLCLC